MKKWMILGVPRYHHFRKPPSYFERHCSHKGQIRREACPIPMSKQICSQVLRLCELLLTYCILLQLLLKCFCLPRELAKLQPLGNLFILFASQADPHGVVRGRLACAITIWASQVWHSPWPHGVVRQKWHAPELVKLSKHQASAWRREQSSSNNGVWQ